MQTQATVKTAVRACVLQAGKAAHVVNVKQGTMGVQMAHVLGANAHP